MYLKKILPRIFWIGLFITLMSSGTKAQYIPDAPNIFIDCHYRCDRNNIKTEIPFVNYMYNRQDADIYIMITSMRTGSGGREVWLYVDANGQFNNHQDTIKYFVQPDVSDRDEQDALVSALKKAFLPYLMQTSLAENLDYTIKKDLNGHQSQRPAIEDPFNNWVYRISGSGSVRGEESYKRNRMTGSLSMSKVTAANKFSFYGRADYNESKFDIDDGSLVSITRSWRGSSTYVKSISPHWSVGGEAYISSSSYSNIDLSVTGRPAVEYSYFPYAEANKRQLTFFYRVGPTYQDYAITTIYNKDEEWVLRESLDIGFKQLEKWGTVFLGIEADNYLHDFSLYRVSFNPELEWNVFKGFSVDLGGYLSYIRDQITIPNESASNEEILLRIKQLKTNYEYFTYFGISYRFGSTSNNIVNPRFNRI